MLRASPTDYDGWKVNLPKNKGRVLVLLHKVYQFLLTARPNQDLPLTFACVIHLLAYQLVASRDQH